MTAEFKPPGWSGATGEVIKRNAAIRARNRNMKLIREMIGGEYKELPEEPMPGAANDCEEFASADGGESEVE